MTTPREILQEMDDREIMIALIHMRIGNMSTPQLRAAMLSMNMLPRHGADEDFGAPYDGMQQ